MVIPQQVTRFYGNMDFAFDVVENRQIAFIHTSLLNDPFDLDCLFDTAFGDNYAGLIRHVKERHPADVRWFSAHLKPRSWIATVKKLKAHLETVKRTTFVLSTSAASPYLHPKDNLYMWGHYGNGHRGVAIEFNAGALENAALAQHTAVNGKQFEEGGVWTQVEYVRSFSPISVEDIYDFMKQEKGVMEGRISERALTRLHRYYNRMSKVKSDVWQSEDEWRLMWQSDETTDPIHKCPIPQDCIAAIYLGLSLPQEFQDRIVSAARSKFPAAKIMKASKRFGDLALDFREIWY